ncbi:hypothetical protein H9Q73_002872 [Fusarium xylarioides]|nr:hypothetical protein H9Q73_002872 [Fusarium xylarioides]
MKETKEILLCVEVVGACYVLVSLMSVAQLFSRQLSFKDKADQPQLLFTQFDLRLKQGSSDYSPLPSL